jgi:pimeloyl-ACP methyl ester carboxylesterase
MNRDIGLPFTSIGSGHRTLVMLHGLGGDRSQPLALIRGVDLAGVRVLAPDLRSHGRCALDESAELLTFAQLAADVEDLLAHEAGPDGVLLAGISMGAALAVELAARQIVPVHGMLLIRPAWRWAPRPENLMPYAVIAEMLARHGARDGRARFRQAPAYARIADVSVLAAEALLGQFDAPRAVARASRLTAIPASTPTRPAVGLDGPVMVIGAGADPVHPRPLAEQVAGDLGARMILAAPRYDAPTEHTRQVGHRIVQFVRET